MSLSVTDLHTLIMDGHPAASTVSGGGYQTVILFTPLHGVVTDQATRSTFQGMPWNHATIVSAIAFGTAYQFDLMTFGIFHHTNYVQEKLRLPYELAAQVADLLNGICASGKVEEDLPG